MLSAFDIQKLRDLPIEEVAGRLGLQVSRHKALCPFHEDRHPSLMFRRGKNTFRCFVCGAGGSGSIDLVMKYLHLTFPEACRWLAAEHSVMLSSSMAPAAARPKPHAVPAEASIDVAYLEGLLAHPSLHAEACRFLFDERRISPSVVSQLGLCSIDRPVPMSRNLNDGWFNAPSLLIPYRDAEGRLLSVQARYLGGPLPQPGTSGGAPRFQFPRGSRCGIYNLPVLKLLAPGEPLFITEGCSDCWAMMSAGHKAIAIPSATLLNPRELERTLARLPHLQPLNLHICPDQDPPGERLYLDLRQHLPHLVRHQLPPGCKDFGQWWAEKKLITKN